MFQGGPEVDYLTDNFLNSRRFQGLGLSRKMEAQRHKQDPETYKKMLSGEGVAQG